VVDPAQPCGIEQRWEIVVEQERLFRLALEALVIRASYRAGAGWELTVRARRQDESWAECPERLYTRLTSPELADVLCSEVVRALNLE